MTTEQKLPRKRDRFLKPLNGIIRRLSPEPHGIARPTQSTDLVSPVQSPSSDVVPPALRTNVLQTTPIPVKSQRPFSKGGSFEKDLALLYTSFVLQENSRLKEVIRLIVLIRNDDEENQLVDVLETCSRISVQLASANDAHPVEAAETVVELEETLKKIRKMQVNGEIATPLSDLSSLLNDEIIKIKLSFLHENNPSEGLARILDVTIGTTVSVLSIVESASSLVPVPLIQPIVTQVVTMLQTVAQTRSNYSDMKDIAARAGEFTVSCAVICSENPAGPSAEFKRSLNKFAKNLESVARECHELSQLGVFSRYFQHSVHARDLQAIRTRLSDSIELFQTETQLNIKFDTEALRKNFDYASLNSLPSHPRYERNEYLENSRDDVIDYISHWITDGPESVLWMHGPAGFGKSTVAQQLIYLLQQEDRLAGGILLTYLSQEHPVEVIRMIARQLGERHPELIADIAQAARTLNSAHDRLEDYVIEYLLNPIRRLNYPYQLVILIDGLDEWTNYESFLRLLGKIPLPSPVKLILTSRFSHSIERALAKIPTHKYSLPAASEEVIERYFVHHFSSDEIDWKGRRPDEHQVSRLALLADGLLIWAATVRSLVLNKFDARFPHIILDEILSSEEKVAAKRGQRLEALYRTALSSVVPVDVQGALQDFLRAILVLQEALPLSDFVRLLRNRIPERTTEEIHRGLTALRVRDDHRSNVISPAIQSYHSSFLQFIQADSIPADSHGHSFPPLHIQSAHRMLGDECVNFVFWEFLPSFRGQTCNYTELNGLERYAIKYWPLHLTHGTDRTLPLSDTVLADIPSAALRRWSALFLPHVSPGFLERHRSLDGILPLELFSELAAVIEKEDVTNRFYLQCLELGVRQQPKEILTWINLGIMHYDFYRQIRDDRNLEDAIATFRQALKLISEARRGVELAKAPANAIGSEAHTETPSEIVSRTQPTSRDESQVMTYLADALESRFERHGTPANLDEAISLFRGALDLQLAPRSFKLLNNYAKALLARFRQQAAPDDTDEVISIMREALELCPTPHPDSWLLCDNLALSLYTRFKIRGAITDLDEAISIHREVIVGASGPPSDRASSLNNLGIALQARFQESDELSDLDEAISLHRKTLGLCGKSHTDRSMYLNNLAHALQSRFGMLGASVDLDESISMHREALSLRPAPHLDRYSSLNNLGNALRVRFKRSGDTHDLDEAISMHREALRLCPAPHLERDRSLTNLANSLHTRFEDLGNIPDLEEAISMHREALHLRPPPHPDRSTTLSNLAGALAARFKHLGASSDLDDVILIHQEALELRPPPHAAHWRSLANLGVALRNRFDHKGAIDDLKKSNFLHRQAVESCPPSQPDYIALVRSSISQLIQLHSLNKSDSAILSEIIMLFRQLIALPHIHAEDRVWALKGLSVALIERHKLLDNPDSAILNEIIMLFRQLIDLPHLRAEDRVWALTGLHVALIERYARLTCDEHDLEEAQNIKKSLSASNTRPSDT